ncbi:hypothetical protein SAMN05428950_10325 [Sphingomonas sp. OV641]|nr:hypothetical protein SAMN05428950_10325 [Sphingomonas sp. OV641]
MKVPAARDNGVAAGIPVRHGQARRPNAELRPLAFATKLLPDSWLTGQKLAVTPKVKIRPLLVFTRMRSASMSVNCSIA